MRKMPGRSPMVFCRLCTAGPHYFRTMSNLIPTPRVDKHGRTVIRHMKPRSSGAPGSKTPVMAPVLKMTADNHGKVLKASASAIAEETDGNMGDIEEQLSIYSTEELAKIAEWSVTKSNARIWSLSDELEETEYVRDFLQLADFIAEQNVNEMNIASHVHALHRYDELAPQGYDGSYPRERLEQCKAALEITLLMRDMIRNDELDPKSVDSGDTSHRQPYITDEKLRSLIFDPSSRAAALNVVIQRRMVRGDEVEAILNEDAGALTDGVL